WTVLQRDRRRTVPRIALEVHRLCAGGSPIVVALSAHAVRRGGAPDPQPDLERPLAECLPRIVSPQHLERAHQRCSATELIEREQSERVPHEYGDACGFKTAMS